MVMAWHRTVDKPLCESMMTQLTGAYISDSRELGAIDYNDVIMSAMASLITSLTIVYPTVRSGADQRKHQSSASLVFVREFTGHLWIPRTKGQ